MADNTKEYTKRLYREVFLTSSGIQVLADILNDCDFFSLVDMTSDADIARLNVARRILGKLGIWETKRLYELTNILAGGDGQIGRLLDGHADDDDNT